jgi:hypothetical protein
MPPGARFSPQARVLPLWLKGIEGVRNVSHRTLQAFGGMPWPARGGIVTRAACGKKSTRQLDLRLRPAIELRKRGSVLKVS